VKAPSAIDAVAVTQRGPLARSAVEVALQRLDGIQAQLSALRRELVEALGDDERGVGIVDTLGGEEDDDLAPVNLISVPAAADRFCRPADSIRFLCRNRAAGIKIDGTWFVSVPRLERYMASRWRE